MGNHHHHSVVEETSRSFRRFRPAFVIMAFLIFCFGAGTLALGKLHYSNYWGGAVFAPFAIFVTLLILIVVYRGPAKSFGSKKSRRPFRR
jgi:hypothetical protein